MGLVPGPRVSALLADITTLDVDVVVNAANSSLLGGAGVDGAIHRAGGPQILAACRELRRTLLPAGLPVGAAVATTAGRLPARHVVHVVGPVWDPARSAALRPLLESCYTEALRLADGLGARTVAFPAVSAGAYGWPVEDAARTAVRAVRAASTQVGEVLLVAYNPAVLDAFRRSLGPDPGPG